MITTNGKRHIKRYLAGYVPVIAASIVYGLGPRVEAAGDTRLQFEVDREPLALTSYDFVNDRLIFKAELPVSFAGTIYEVAIFSELENSVSGGFGSKLLMSFDSATEEWMNGVNPSTYATGNSRLGADSLRQAVAASGSRTDTLSELSLDLGGYSGADRFVFAFNTSSSNVSSMRVRMLTDATNYYDFNLGSQTTGYKVVEAAKSSAVATGSPNWSSITSVEVTTNATASGPVDVDFDGIRVEDDDAQNPDYVMVARKVLATPVVKESGKTQEIEFALSVAL